MTQPSSDTGTWCPLAELENAVLPPNFCAFALPVAVNRARSLVTLVPRNAHHNGNSDAATFLVLERGKSAVTVVYDEDGDGIPESQQIVVSADNLNHGLVIDPSQTFLYASSDSTVYRWPLPPATTTTSTLTLQLLELAASTMSPQQVIQNMNDNGRGSNRAGNHVTRTLLFDATGRLYVSVGSVGNIDVDSYRSRIRQFTVDNDNVAAGPLEFATGPVVADGVRNEVGMAIDQHGILWGVENGPDNLQREDLGGRITNDNPGEEVHRFGSTTTEDEDDTSPPLHYGYPYCWTEFALDTNVGQGRGTVWAWPSFLNDGMVTDETCRTEYATAELVIQAHSAPLGMTFYQYRNDTERPATCASQGGGGAFPRGMDGYAFVALHGSWNRDIPTGYKVVYIPMNEQGRVKQPPSVVDLLAHAGSGAKWPDGFRPVDVAFDACGRLLVSSDGTGNVGSKIVRIEYHGDQDTGEEELVPPIGPSPFPTAAPSSTATGRESFSVEVLPLLVVLWCFIIRFY